MQEEGKGGQMKISTIVTANDNDNGLQRQRYNDNDSCHVVNNDAIFSAASACSQPQQSKGLLHARHQWAHRMQ
jgi:hypothetical protein